MAFPVTFVNPLFLAGLAFAAAPVVLHLMRRDPGRRVPFPAAMLLVSSADVVTRRWSPAELLLLALRVLVIAGFVLALARPRIAMRGVAGQETVLASVAIVVDDTPSMGARGGVGSTASSPPRGGNGGSTRMAEARRAVLRILDRLQPGSRVRLRCASRLLLDECVDLEEARRAAEGLTVSGVASSLPDALAESVAWLRNEPSPKELHVLSDFQRSSWTVADPASRGEVGSTTLPPPRGRGRALRPGRGVPVYIVDVGDVGDVGKAGLDDWALTRVRVTEPRVLRRMLFELRVEVRASSPGTREVVLEVDGREARRETLRLAAGERTEVAFEVAAQDAGPLLGVARLLSGGRGAPEDGDGLDDWPENDSRAFAVQVLPAARVLCVRAPSGDGAVAGELVSRALAPFAGGERELVRVDEILPPLPSRGELDRYDCVAVAAPSRLGAEDWRRLGAFVEDGGGMLVFPDEGLLRKGFRPGARGLLPVSSVRPGGPSSSARLATGLTTRPVRLTGLDYGHPMLRGFEGGANGGIESVRFRRFFELLGLAEAAGARISVLAWFGAADGEGERARALVETARGRGRVLFFASGPTALWGDLFREPVFVPFLHEAVAYLARSGPAQHAVLAGERLSVELHPAERGFSARLEDRSASPPLVRELAVDAERLELPLGRLERRGVFHIVTGGTSGAVRLGGGGRERAVAVELDPREFETERTEPAEIFGRRVHLARSGGELASAFTRTRGGSEVTGYVVWATLAVFLAEMLVSGALTRRRSRSQGQAANVRGAI